MPIDVATVSIRKYLRFLEDEDRKRFSEIAQSEKHLASRLALKPRALRRMRRNGLTPIGFKIGRETYYRNEDIASWFLRMP